jgi:hypothetical protein
MKMKENPEDDLKHTAPLLASVSRENPFSVPAHYFDDLSQAVMRAVEKSETALHGIEIKSPFDVPEGYFDRLPEMIRDRIATKERGKIKFLRPVLATSLAAACVVLLLVTRPSQPDGGVQPVNGGSLTAQELGASTLFGSMDEQMLIEMLEEKNAQALPGETEDAENYLIDNHIELDQITNEL